MAKDTDKKPQKLAPMEPGGRPGHEWPKEVGGPKGPEPTRYGDWEKKGRCSDF